MSDINFPPSRLVIPIYTSQCHNEEPPAYRRHEGAPPPAYEASSAPSSPTSSTSSSPVEYSPTSRISSTIPQGFNPLSRRGSVPSTSRTGNDCGCSFLKRHSCQTRARNSSISGASPATPVPQYRTRALSISQPDISSSGTNSRRRSVSKFVEESIIDEDNQAFM